MRDNIVSILSFENNKAIRNLLCVGLMCGVVVSGSSCASSPDGLFSGDEALELAAEQMDFGDRIPGSDAHHQTGEWIVAKLETCGWETTIQAFEHQGVQLRNIIGKTDERTSPGPIILGAHYDTRPHADLDLHDPSLPVPGANDGASGVAVLLELARVQEINEATHPVWLVFFDAEDSGNINGWDWIVGSKYFVEHLMIQPEAVVIVDMVGDDDLQLYYEWNSDHELAQEIWRIASGQGHAAFIQTERYSLIDDHTPFLNAGIPAVDIIDFDYPYWHTTEDTMDKISASSLEQVGRTLQQWVEWRVTTEANDEIIEIDTRENP